MTNSLLISISDKENYLRVLVSKNIYYRNLVHKDNLIYLVINESDLDILKKEFLSLNVVKYYGKKRIKYFLKEHYIFILSFLFSYIVLVILSNVIFDVEVVTNNNKLKDKIYLYLKDYGIEKYKFIKNSNKLDSIKEKILRDNKDDLEWIEITRSGTKYTVNLTERIINNEVENNKVSDIVAKKDALITHLTIKRGSALKEVNELVHKGEVIITGNILKDEKIVDTVRAEGSVYGEVWYTVNVSVPYKHTEYFKTGEVVNHIYLDVFGKKFTLIGHYVTENAISEETVLVNKPYLPFKVIRESKELYTYKSVNLNKEEAFEECLKRGDKSILNKLDTSEHIIERKVLKKEEFSSKIEVELFYRVYENISEEKEITLESE